MISLRVPAWANGRKNLPLQIFRSLIFRGDGISWVIKSISGLVGSWPDFTVDEFYSRLLMSDGELKLSHNDILFFFNGISDLDEIYFVGLSEGEIVVELELVDSTFWIILFDLDFIDRK